MSDCTAKLCVWVTEFGDPCHIMHTEQFYVHVTDCEGKLLKWCDKTYSFFPTTCGMVEIEVPPGCYSVFATHSERKQGTDLTGGFGNRLTHIQVVRVNCGDHVCVTLFSPYLSNCGTWFAAAVKGQYAALENAHIDTQLARAAVTAVEAFVAKLPPSTLGENVARLMLQEPPK
jgi:hypothetical protein